MKPAQASICLRPLVKEGKVEKDKFVSVQVTNIDDWKIVVLQIVIMR
jgi:hypothetical protein